MQFQRFKQCSNCGNALDEEDEILGIITVCVIYVKGISALKECINNDYQCWKPCANNKPMRLF